MIKPYIRIIGDCHGAIRNTHVGRSYKGLINGIPYSVQLGDLGFDYSPLDDVDPIRHRVIMGNHDNYDAIPPHALGDYGTHVIPLKNGSEFKFFFIRGAFSIDQYRRILGISYWANEELSWEQMYAMIPVWEKEKPEIVISHDCPASLLPLVGCPFRDLKPSRTCNIMDNLFALHKPKLWIFGHHHQNKVMKNVFDSNTTFICLNGQIDCYQMGFLDFDDEGKMIGEGPQ